MARARFARGSSKIQKPRAGRTPVERTPVTIRSSELLGSAFKARIRTQLANRVGFAANLIERITVRFEDVNGPKGGIDTVCRIKAVMSRRPAIVVEEQAGDHAIAFSRALTALSTAIRRELGKHGLAAGPSTAGRGKPRATRPAAKRQTRRDPGELIGRRVGRGQDAVERALRRPEKRNRAHYVDTAAPDTSASDRRAGGPYTARRNTLARTRRATAALEDSRTRPSRKSTRRSVEHGKPSQMKERAALQKHLTPRARAARR